MFGKSDESTTPVAVASTEALLAEAKELEAEKEAGEVGPEYYAKRRRELTDALANVLRQQDTSRKAQSNVD